MEIAYSQNISENKEELRLSYGDSSSCEESWEDLQSLLELVGGEDGANIAPLEGQVYSAFCDIISVNFGEIATRVRELVVMKHSPKRSLTLKNKSIHEQIFAYLHDVHPLLADPLDIRIAVLRIEDEYFSPYHGKSKNTDAVIFRKFLRVQKYINELIEGNTRLYNKNVWLRYSSRYLLSQMPMQFSAPPILDYDRKTLISAEKELEIEFEQFLHTLDDETMLGDSYFCENISQFFTASVYSLLERGLTVKRCSNCGKYFVPLTRSDAIYCDRVSPQDKSCSCKEYGSKRLWYDRLKDDEAAKLSRNIYMAKQMLVKRNPDIVGYKEMFEFFKCERKKWEADIKSGVRCREAYIEWLNEMKSKKVL